MRGVAIGLLPPGADLFPPRMLVRDFLPNEVDLPRDDDKIFAGFQSMSSNDPLSFGDPSVPSSRVENWSLSLDFLLRPENEPLAHPAMLILRAPLSRAAIASPGAPLLYVLGLDVREEGLDVGVPEGVSELCTEERLLRNAGVCEPSSSSVESNEVVLAPRGRTEEERVEFAEDVLGDLDFRDVERGLPGLRIEELRVALNKFGVNLNLRD